MTNGTRDDDRGGRDRPRTGNPGSTDDVPNPPDVMNVAVAAGVGGLIGGAIGAVIGVLLT